MNKFVLLAAMLLSLPLAAEAGKKDSKSTVVVEIPTSRGTASIPLVHKGSGFVGPRGEYYPAFPSKQTLAAVYGGGSVRPAPAPRPAASLSGDLKVVSVEGGVNIRLNGRLLSQIRTQKPSVSGWRLIRENSAIVIKSNRRGEPGTVELFDVRTGRLEARVKATDVKDGKPAWAKHFAE